MALIATRSLQASGTSLANAPYEPWAQPTDLALNNTGPVNSTEASRNYDCTWLTYRMIDDLSKAMHSGCFTQAAFGLFESEQSVVIFNGTDEAENVRVNGQVAALSVLPYSGAVAKFSGFPAVGTYMHIYTDFFGAMHNSGIPLLNRHKEVSIEPNFTVRDSSGLALPINTTALAYSARGQWMVTESPTNSLVRVNLATFSILPFDKSFHVPGMPYASHAASMAITEDGRYAAAVSNEFASFKVYDLAACTVTNAADDLAPQHCQSHDYWSYVRSQVGGNLQRITQVRFVRDGLISFTATSGTTTDSYLLSPSGQITSLIPYLGLGDSYASGQGAFNYRTGTDTAANHCHLSARSYPLRLSGDLFGNRGHSVACSGARITDIGNQSPEYTGQANDQRSAQSREADGSETTILHDFSPGYIAQERFLTSYLPGVVTVQIGGNDVGFKDMMLRCVSPLASLNNCYQSYEDRLEIEQTIGRNYGRWVQLFKQLQRSSPSSRLYAIGYPHIVSARGDCRLNVHLSLGDINFARDVVFYLNGVIQKAARAAGVRYIDITDALVGYELCSGSGGELAVNGITAGTDAAGLLGQESFHPTAFGHELIEQAILNGTHNFAIDTRPSSNPGEAAPVPKDNDPLLQAPKTGRAIRTVIPASGAIAPVSGSSVHISVNGTEHGLVPNSPYTVELDGGSAGTVHSDEHGNIQDTLPVPESTAPGAQQGTVTGPNQTGGTTTIVEIIYVPDTPPDNNGDSAPGEIRQPPLQPTTPPSVEAGSSHIQTTNAPNNSMAGGLAYVAAGTSRPLSLKNTANVTLDKPLGSSTTTKDVPHGALKRFLWYWWLLILAACLTLSSVCRHLGQHFKRS